MIWTTTFRIKRKGKYLNEYYTNVEVWFFIVIPIFISIY